MKTFSKTFLLTKKKLFTTLMTALAIMVMSVATALAAEDGVDWNTNVITVQGMGAPSPRALNQFIAMQQAKRAAIVDAQRNLAEAVKGVNVDATTTVENMTLTNDVVVTRTNALIQGARVTNVEYVNGGCIVTMEMPLFGGNNALANAVMPTNAKRESFPTPVPSVSPSLPGYDSSASIDVRIDISSQEQQQQATNNRAIGGFTGLVVDCRGLNLKAVMSPVIKNVNGQAIYGHKNIDADYVIQNGMASYTNDIYLASRAGANPLVVKAVALNDHNSTPVLSVADANRVLIENKVSGFLDKTKVVFVR